MTNLENVHVCVRAEAGALPVEHMPAEHLPAEHLPAEDADDLDDEPRRDDSLDSILREESQKPGELDDVLPEGVPEYGDLLDVDWLERTADSVEMEEEVVDVGLTLDLDERDDLEEAGLAIEFDVGSLLTLLPSEGVPLAVLPSELPSDGSFGATSLDDLLLPEESVELGLNRGDDEVGDDERFPVFDDEELVPSVPPAEEEDVPAGSGDLD